MVNALLLATAVALGGRHLVTRDLAECPTYPTCPADTGCMWTDPSNGAEFVTNCENDLVGGDLQTVHATGFDNCLQACSLTTGCVAISFRDDGFCYLKNAINPAVSKTNVDAATISVSGMPSTQKRFKCNGAITCPYYDNCLWSNSTASRTRQLVISCDSDFYGGDYTNISASTFQVCTSACVKDSRCLAVSYDPDEKICWLKDHTQPYYYSSKLNGAYLSTTTPPNL